MVNGLNKFKEYFKDYKDNYLLIGGAACDRHIENAGLDFRATKDLDIILIVEAYSADFVEKFWSFIAEGKYEVQEKSSGKKIYYRFKEPAGNSFPWQLELFARNPDIIIKYNAHLIPIPLDEDVTSLSAILLNDDYYNFTLTHSDFIDEIHLASISALICLKAHAYLDLKSRHRQGEKIDSKDIRKHRNDIIRLTAILTQEEINDLPGLIAQDLTELIKEFRNDPPDVAAVAKSLGVPSLNFEDLLQQLKRNFHL
jgi:hypothetical protein